MVPHHLIFINFLNIQRMRYRKKHYPLKVLSVLICCIVITTLSSCSKDDLLYQNTPYDKESFDFTISDAQMYYESIAVTGLIKA